MSDEIKIEEIEEQEGDFTLPFDPLLLIRGVLRKSWILVLFLIIGLPFSYVATKKIVPVSYKSEATLMRKVGDMKKSNLGVLALADFLLLPDILRRLRKELSLPLKIKELASSLSIEAQPRTGIMKLSLEHDTPHSAQKILKHLLDIFLEKTQDFKIRVTTQLIKYYDNRLGEIKAKVRQCQISLKKFKETNGVVDLQSGVIETLNRYNALDAAYHDYEAQAKVASLRLTNLDKIVKQISQQLSAERQQAADADSITNMKQKSLRLQQQVKELRQRKQWQLEMAKVQKDLTRLERMSQPGYIPEVEVEKVRLQRDLLNLKMTDSNEIKSLRKKIKKIDELLVPTSNNNSVNLLLKDTMVRQFLLRLDRAALFQKSAQIKRARDQVVEEIGKLPAMEAGYANIIRQLESAEKYQMTLHSKIDELQAKVRKESRAFKILQPPTLPRKPEKTKKKIVFLGLAGAFCSLGVLLIIYLESASLLIRVGREVETRLHMPLLGMFYDDRYVSEDERLETIRHSVYKLSQESDKKVFLLTSLKSHAELMVIVYQLSKQFFVRGCRVLIIDMDTRSEREDDWFLEKYGFPTIIGTLKDLVNENGRFSSEKRRATVDLITNKGKTEELSHIERPSFKSELDKLSKDYDYCFILAPELSQWPEVSLVKWAVEGILIALEASRFSHWEVNRELLRIGLSNEQICGVFLTKVDPLLTNGRGWDNGAFEPAFCSI